MKSSRIYWLLAAHACLAWLATAAAAFALPTDVGVFAASTLFAAHVFLCGLIVGLLLSDSPGPIRHQQSRPLRRFALGLMALWAPVAFVLGDFGEAIGIVVVGGCMIWVVIGLIAVVVAISLAVFDLCLTDELDGDARMIAAETRQFSLRQLIGMTTLVAVACAAFKLWSPSTSLADLWREVAVLGGIFMLTAALWLVTIAVPLVAVLATNHPWRNSLLAIAVAEVMAIGAGLAFRTRGSTHLDLTLAIIVTSYLNLVMASLGVLRSCGLRLTRHRTAYELAVRPPGKLVSADQRPS
jgi:hypothetical protein